MSKCTWVDCEYEARVEQKSKDGSVWANLCDAHDQEIGDFSVPVPKLLSNWVKAQGGAEAASRRM